MSRCAQPPIRHSPIYIYIYIYMPNRHPSLAGRSLLMPLWWARLTSGYVMLLLTCLQGWILVLAWYNLNPKTGLASLTRLS